MRSLCLTPLLAVALTACATSTPTPTETPKPKPKPPATFAEWSATDLEPTAIGKEAIHSGIWIPRDGSGVYSATFREKVEYSSYYDLSYRPKGGAAKIIADLKSDWYWGYFKQDGTFLTTAAIKSHETRRLMSFQKGAPNKTPFDGLQKIGNVNLMNDRALITSEGTLMIEQTTGAIEIPLVNRTITSCHKQRNICLLRENVEDTNGDGEVSYDDLDTLMWIDFGDDLSGRDFKPLLTETASANITPFGWVDERQVLLLRREDTNGDGKALSPPDEDKTSFELLDVTTGELRTVCEEGVVLSFPDVGAEGLIFYGKQKERHGPTEIRVCDTKTGKADTLVGGLEGDPRFVRVSEGGRAVYFAMIRDSSGDGNRYYWEDMSQLHRVGLAP